MAKDHLDECLGIFAFVWVRRLVITFGGKHFGKRKKLDYDKKNLLVDEKNGLNEEGEMAELNWSRKYDLETVTIRANSKITCIPAHAFKEAYKLHTVHIDPTFSTLKSINTHCFSCCDKIISIDIPEGVHTLGYCSFWECHALTYIHVPNSVTSIDSYCFFDCQSLQSIYIPRHVTSVSHCSFHYCKKLQLIELPENMRTSFSHEAFQECMTLHARKEYIDYANYHPDTITWLRRRFYNRPIHRTCYRACNDKTTVRFLNAVVTINKQQIGLVDALGMTALHILCFHRSHVTAEHMKVVLDADPTLLGVKDVTGQTPLMKFLKCRNLAEDAPKYDPYDLPIQSRFLGSRRRRYDVDDEIVIPSLHDILKKGINGKDLDILFLLNRNYEMDLSIPQEMTIRQEHGETALMPFMVAATSKGCGLDVVHALAMKSLDLEKFSRGDEDRGRNWLSYLSHTVSKKLSIKNCMT